jgi:hypothetical protein
MSGAVGRLEASDAFCVVAEYDAFDPIEPGVEPIERCMDAIERA